MLRSNVQVVVYRWQCPPKSSAQVAVPVVLVSAKGQCTGGSVQMAVSANGQCTDGSVQGAVHRWQWQCQPRGSVHVAVSANWQCTGGRVSQGAVYKWQCIGGSVNQSA